MANDSATTLKQPVSEEDRRRGPADAPVTLVEYADYECPDCQHSYPVIERVLESVGERVQFVFRHFPVISRHPRAEAAALAAEAAGAQGRFWEMHRRIMEAGGALSEDDLKRYAADSGLDLERFEHERQDEEARRRIRQGKVLGVRSGVNGTPTLFINGMRYEGETEPVDERELIEAIEAAERGSE